MSDNDPPSSSNADETLQHDLSQPLTALLLYLQAMRTVADRQPGALSGDLRALLDKALAEAERATVLAEALRGRKPPEPPCGETNPTTEI